MGLSGSLGGILLVDLLVRFGFGWLFDLFCWVLGFIALLLVDLSGGLVSW